MSIFVVEHNKDGAWQVETIICEDLDTSQYQPIQKIFVCESMDEARVVSDELHNERLKVLYATNVIQ
jgi:hypothetical protein